MAIYQNITLLYRQIEEVPIQSFFPVLSKHFAKYRSHYEPLLLNKLQHELNVSNNMANLELSLLLVQVKFTLLFSNSKLLAPFLELINSPNSMADTFFPTMPQDSLFDIQNAVRAGSKSDAPKFYACPNGHIYILFDCGRPWVIHKCKTCGEDIGGQNHVLLATNKVVDVQDKTLKAYPLQDCTVQPQNEPTSERLLSPSAFHIIRFFLHACMYFSYEKNGNNLVTIMANKPANVFDFFWRHMQKDLELSRKALNINADEIYLILHTICNEILKGFNVSTARNWSSKEERQNWEKDFSDHYLFSIIQDPSKVISKAAKTLKAEEEKNTEESQKVYFMAYELTSQKENIKLYENPMFWKFQPNVDLNTMNIELANGTRIEEFKILKKLIETIEHLQLLTYLPPIVRLVNCLNKRYYKRLFKHFARSNSLQDLLNSTEIEFDMGFNEVTESIQCLERAWNSAKAILPAYMRETFPQQQAVKFNADQEFNVDSKVSHLLPTTSGDGLPIYVLLHFLSSIHNDLISFYFNKKSIQRGKDDEVELKHFENPEFVISITEDELLRVVQSNFSFDSKNSKCCSRQLNYSFFFNCAYSRCCGFAFFPSC